MGWIKKAASGESKVGATIVFVEWGIVSLLLSQRQPDKVILVI
jgi:hypothetical protein